jgi:aminomethyltransferase
MGKAIALASVPKGSEGVCEIEMRNKRVSAKIVKPVLRGHIWDQEKLTL